MRVTFFRHRERGAQLHGVGAEVEQMPNLLVTVDPPRDNQRDILHLQPKRLEQFARAFQHMLERIVRMVEPIERRRAEMPSRITRVLDDNSVRQAVSAHPLFQHQADTACIRQDWNQRHVRKVGSQLRQVQRQTRADHDRTCATFACLGDV
ncbi:hypothetical protein IHE27_03995 [Mycetohabitans endofungorum]|nr:hypothetical protein [Mycetohabitans sp. B3]